jgi:hypothetical protein
MVSALMKICYLSSTKNRSDMERFSMKEVLKNKFGESEKSKKGAKATKRASERSEKKDEGKYVTKIVGGVKYMTLR